MTVDETTLSYDQIAVSIEESIDEPVLVLGPGDNTSENLALVELET